MVILPEPLCVSTTRGFGCHFRVAGVCDCLGMAPREAKPTAGGWTPSRLPSLDGSMSTVEDLLGVVASMPDVDDQLHPEGLPEYAVYCMSLLSNLASEWCHEVTGPAAVQSTLDRMDDLRVLLHRLACLCGSLCVLCAKPARVRTFVEFDIPTMFHALVSRVLPALCARSSPLCVFMEVVSVIVEVYSVVGLRHKAGTDPAATLALSVLDFFSFVREGVSAIAPSEPTGTSALVAVGIWVVRALWAMKVHAPGTSMIVARSRAVEFLGDMRPIATVCAWGGSPLGALISTEVARLGLAHDLGRDAEVFTRPSVDVFDFDTLLFDQ